MNAATTISGHQRRGDQVVRAPRVTDGIGRTLRSVFATTPLPRDLERLLCRLDRAD